MKILSLILLLFVLTGCLYNYPTVIPDDTPKTDKEETIRENVKKHLKDIYSNQYAPVLFGQLFELKPDEIQKLDDLIETKNQLPLLKENYGDQLDSVIKSQDQKIAKQKIFIKENKIYPWYEVNHIFSLKEEGEDSVWIKEIDFEVYPNYKIKDATQIMDLKLSKKEFKVFNYFIGQNPVYENENYGLANELNETFYNQSFAALENEKTYKGELLKTIIYITDYIMRNNEFDEQDFTRSMAKKWEINNLLGDPKSIKFSLLKPEYSIVDEVEVVTGYRLKHTIHRNKEGKDQTSEVSFLFDLNFVLISVQEKSTTK